MPNTLLTYFILIRGIGLILLNIGIGGSKALAALER
jgi:hypothetical protein